MFVPIRWLLISLSLVAMAALLATACRNASYATLTRQGNEQYERHDYAAALATYREAQVQRPDLPQINFNVGNALYRLEDYARAVEETRRTLTTEDTTILAQAYYNLGNQYFRMEQLQEAFSAYKSALIYDPDDQDAKYNLEVVLLRLQAAQQPSTPDNQQQQQPAPSQTQTPSKPDNSANPGDPSKQPNSEPGGSPADRATDLKQAERDLADALAMGDDNNNKEFTVEEALRALDLLAERQRLRQSQEEPPSSRRGYRDW